MPGSELDEVARMRKEADQNRKLALTFFATAAPERLSAMLAVLNAELELMASLLRDNEKEWEIGELTAFMENGQRSYHLVELHKAAQRGGKFAQFLVKCRQTLCESILWSECHQTIYFASYIHKLAARAAAVTYQLAVLPALAWPTKLFALLAEPERAVAERLLDEYARHPCLLDPFSVHFMSTHDSPELFLSQPALSTLASVAEVTVTNTFNIEREHTKNIARTRNRVTHAMALGDVALWRMAVAGPGWVDIQAKDHQAMLLENTPVTMVP